MRSIDINADIGEGLPWDHDLIQIITSANVCCGAHAGSPELTHQKVALCKANGVRVGAHPGYPDRANFGRLSMTFTHWETLLESLLEQQREIAQPAYLKPHGALYHDSMRFGDASTALVHLLSGGNAFLMGMPGTGHEEVARRAGVPLIREGFAERGYRADGHLLPRGTPGALLTERAEIEDQVLHLAERVDSICIHGDSQGCVEIALWVKEALDRGGYQVGSNL